MWNGVKWHKGVLPELKPDQLVQEKLYYKAGFHRNTQNQKYNKYLHKPRHD